MDLKKRHFFTIWPKKVDFSGKWPKQGKCAIFGRFWWFSGLCCLSKWPFFGRFFVWQDHFLEKWPKTILYGFLRVPFGSAKGSLFDDFWSLFWTIFDRFPRSLFGHFLVSDFPKFGVSKWCLFRWFTKHERAEFGMIEKPVFSPNSEQTSDV